MKIKDGFILRQIAGSNIVVPLGEAQMTFKGMMTLNDVGALVWKTLENGADKEDIVKAVLEEYDIDAETASRDIDKYLMKLREQNLIED